MSLDAPLSRTGLLETFAREVAGAVVALSGGRADLTPAPPAETAWLVEVTASGAAAGTIHLALSDGDARRVSAVIMSFDPAEIGDDAVADTLRELGSQAIGALSQMPATAPVALAIADVARAPLPESPAAAFALPLEGGEPVTLVMGGTVTLDGPAVAPTPAVADRASGVPVIATSVAPVVTAPPITTAPVRSVPATGNLDLLLDIQLPLAVRFGATELALHTLTRLGPGSVIDLHRSSDEPVEVLVSGKVIAKGEVVVVEGNYGVRITEVVSAADRIRSLGA